MSRKFPVEVGLEDIRGVLRILESHGGSASVKTIKTDWKKQRCDPMTVLAACEKLRLAKRRNTVVKMSKLLMKKKGSDVDKLVRTRIKKLQPFSMITKLLKKHFELSTPDMFEILLEKKLIDYKDTLPELNRFYGNLIRSYGDFQVLDYDQSNDLWSRYGSIMKRHE